MATRQARKQRKAITHAPTHVKRRRMQSKLDTALKEAGVRSLPVREGDTVRILRGNHINEEGRVAFVDTRNGKLRIEGIVHTKADGKQVENLIHHSKVLIIKGDLRSDRKRAAILDRRGNK